jgi:O-antigen/teichoic acid export membrane protein
MGMELIATAVNTAFAPWLFKQLSNVTIQIKRKIVRITYNYIIGYTVLTVIYALCMPVFMMFFLGEKFHDSTIYVWGFCIASIFDAMYFMVVNYIFFVSKTKFLSIITITTGIFHVLITYFLISMFGPLGATYSAIITSSIRFLFTFFLSNKVYHMPWINF